MSRNKNSNETAEKILEIATKLFSKKGYNKTSIQDIINELGMSKGAIYYHFKSKDDILRKMLDKQISLGKDEALEAYDDIYDSNLSVADNLKNVFDVTNHACFNPIEVEADIAIFKTPELLCEYMTSNIDVIAPVLGSKFRMGIEDGSITTEYPEEAAELVTLCMNIFSNPILFRCTDEKLHKRMMFIQYVFHSIGCDIMSDELFTRFNDYSLQLNEFLRNNHTIADTPEDKIK